MSTETIPPPHPPKPNVQKVQQRGSVQLCLDSYVERVVAKNSQFIGLFWFCVFFFTAVISLWSQLNSNKKRKKEQKRHVSDVFQRVAVVRGRVSGSGSRGCQRSGHHDGPSSSSTIARPGNLLAPVQRLLCTAHRVAAVHASCCHHLDARGMCWQFRVDRVDLWIVRFSESAHWPCFSTSLDDRPCSDLLRKDFLLAHTPVPLNPYKINLKWCLFKRKWTRVTLWANFLLSLRIQQVTEEQNCEEQVFPLAVNLLDRFLALEASVLQRCQLQLLGCVCLLTASKLRQCRPIGVELLVYYTDYSVTPAQIRVSTFIIFLSEFR